MTALFVWCHETKPIIPGIGNYAACFLEWFSLSRWKRFVLLPSGVEVEIVEMPFQRASFTVSDCDDHSAACLINGHVPFGTDLGLPKTFVRRIRVSYQDMPIHWIRRICMMLGVAVASLQRGIRYFGGMCVDTETANFVEYSLMQQAHS